MYRKVNTDLLSGLFGLVFMAFFWIAKEGVGDLSIKFPQALLVLTGFFSTALIVKGLWREKAERATVFTEGDRTRMVVTGISLFLWLGATLVVGFYIGSVIIFFSLTCYLASAREGLQAKTVLRWLFVILLEVAIFDVIFSRLLYVPLPRGLFF